MRTIILAFLLLTANLSLYAQNKAVNVTAILDEVAILYKNGEYELSLRKLEALAHLNRSTRINEQYYTYSVYNRYHILQDAKEPSWTDISKIREDLKLYFRMVKDKSGEVVKINDDIIRNYPKTYDEYSRFISDRRQKELDARNSIILNKIKQLYENKRYDDALKEIIAAKEVGYDDENILYYEFMSTYTKYIGSERKSYYENEKIVSLGNRYVNNVKSNAQMGKEVRNILEGLPKSLDAFNANLQREEAIRQEKRRLDRLTYMRNAFEAENYNYVLTVENIFEGDNEKLQEYRFLLAVSPYLMLNKRKDRVFSNISSEDVEAARALLQNYLNSRTNSSFYYAKVQEYMRSLNLNYGKNKVEFTSLKNNAISQVAKEKRAIEKERAKAIKRSQRSMFTSIGYEYGEYAPYGLRFEVGGRTVGMFAIARTGLITDDDLSEEYYNTGNSKPNKTEILLGPNLKIVDWMYINIGGGYGFYKHIFRDDYANFEGIGRSNYWAGYAGVTIRLGKSINLNGGASFIDIARQYSDKTFKKPEFTAGFTINLR